MAVLGGDLKKAELLSARLGDVMSFLYGAMAAIRFYETRIEDRQQALPYFQYAMEYSLGQAEKAIVAFINNFPNTPTRGLMRLLTNTYGNGTSEISDDLVRDLAMASMQDNSAKAQLTHLIKPIAGDGHDINEQAFKAKHAVAHLLGKVQKALRKEPVVPFVSLENALNKLAERGVITADEAAALHDYNEKRKLAVRVDEYTFDLELCDADGKPLSAQKVEAAKSAA